RVSTWVSKPGPLSATVRRTRCCRTPSSPLDSVSRACTYMSASSMGCVWHAASRALATSLWTSWRSYMGAPSMAGRLNSNTAARRTSGRIPAIQHQDIGDQCVEVHLLHLGGRRTGVLAEVVHHVLERGHLIDDGIGRADQHRGVAFVQAVGKLHGQTLGRQLDGRKRILDFVRQTPCHLAPGHCAVGRYDFADVVKHHEIAIAPTIDSKM